MKMAIKVKEEMSGQKIAVTPSFSVDETKTIGERVKNSVRAFVPLFVVWVIYYIFAKHGVFGLPIAWLILLVGFPLLAFLLPGRNKFFLCGEGVVVGQRFQRELHRWDAFHSFTINNSKRQFRLKKSRGSVLLTTREHFNEVRQILSEHISPKQ